MKNILLVITFCAALTSTFAQQTSIPKVFTGNLSADARVVLNDFEEPIQSQMIVISNDNKKSPLLAGVLSAIIPGAGEIYTGEYLKAGIFVVLEAAVLTTAVIYDNKGDRKTNEFQDYADAYTNPAHNWSVVEYANWLVENEYAPDRWAELKAKIIISNDQSIPPWDRVNWSQLNAIESGSHKLPPHGEQQYYELIGKYHQYASGWNDFTGDINVISPNFLFYSQMRGEANDFYSTASTAVIGIYVNHLLSTLDAVWSSIRYNKDIAVKIRLENIQLSKNQTEFYPKVYFTYNF